MKKNNFFIFLFLSIFIFLILIILFLNIQKFNITLISRDVNEHNFKFKEFDRNLKGTELISLINLTVDHNNKEKDFNEKQMPLSQVLIEVKTNEEDIVDMNKILDLGIENFLKYLGDQNFKPIKKEYYANGKISLLRYKLLDVDSLNNLEDKNTI